MDTATETALEVVKLADRLDEILLKLDQLQEWASDLERSGKYALYKTSGALQASMMLPRRDQRGFIERDGGILLEVAAGIGKQKWDWKNKITFALGLQDITILLGSREKNVEAFHETGDKTWKKIAVTHGKNGTYMLRVIDNGDNNVLVAFSGTEWEMFMTLLLNQAPKLIAW